MLRATNPRLIAPAASATIITGTAAWAESTPSVLRTRRRMSKGGALPVFSVSTPRRGIAPAKHNA